MARSKRQKLARRKFDNWMERGVRKARNPKRKIIEKIFLDEIKESLGDEREKLVFQRLILENGYTLKDVALELSCFELDGVAMDGKRLYEKIPKPKERTKLIENERLKVIVEISFQMVHKIFKRVCRKAKKFF